MGGSGHFKLDTVTKEVLEIFSNLLRTSINRVRIIKKHFTKGKRSFGNATGGSASNFPNSMMHSPSPVKI